MNDKPPRHRASDLEDAPVLSAEQAPLGADASQNAWTQPTRKALTADEKAAMVSRAANWLRLGQRVRIVGAAPSIDGSSERRVGRTGVVWRLCSPPFDDHVHINLDLLGRERSQKIVFVELRHLMPLEDERQVRRK